MRMSPFIRRYIVVDKRMERKIGVFNMRRTAHSIKKIISGIVFIL